MSDREAILKFAAELARIRDMPMFHDAGQALDQVIRDMRLHVGNTKDETESLRLRLTELRPHAAWCTWRDRGDAHPCACQKAQENP